jgi:type IV fimbrial biogenesis protein FimT
MTGALLPSVRPKLRFMESSHQSTQATILRTKPMSSPEALLGFSLIELLVAIAVLSIILAIGIPNLREFLVRSQVSTITSEFSNDIYRARAEAINRNSCTTICMSADTSNALNGGTPTCAAAGNNWQAGWIIFSNPTCGAALNDPTQNNNQLISVRQSGSDQFTLIAASGITRFVFDARGLVTAGAQNFTLSYVPDTNISTQHFRSICIGTAGRVNTKKYAGVGVCP